MIPKPSRTITILGQDPSLLSKDGALLTAQVTIPNEQLSAGPRGYRIQVIDYDSSSNRLYAPLDPGEMGTVHEPADPFVRRKNEDAAKYNKRLLNDPRFHAQNVYAISMRTLAHFERALGRRVSWSFGGHQLKVAPHAFAEANAFYSPREESLLFGYFAGPKGAVCTSLSHDIVAHETTHALVDGLRPRFMEPSSADQAAFHEAFADIVALLSVFSIPEVVRYAVRQAVRQPDVPIIKLSQLTTSALQQGILLGLGEQFGETLTGVHGASLRRSVALKPSPDLLNQPEYQEEHRRGEILVAAMLQAFLSTLRARLETLGMDRRNQLPPQRVEEEGADIADRMLTMSIRALDYTPPTDIEFGDYLSAVITSDLEIRPDDSRYHVRQHLREAFLSFGIKPASSYAGEIGCWQPPMEQIPTATKAKKKPKEKPKELDYTFVHREALQRDRDEMFRFLWDNRDLLGLCDRAYTEIGGVRPCLRVDQDGFTIRETVADYVQILTLRAGELDTIEIPDRKGRIHKPRGLSDWRTVRLLGGGSLIFDEFGRLKYHIRNSLLSPAKQTRRLKHLFESGYFDQVVQRGTGFAQLHMKDLRPELPAATKE
jgi:hypothetical protein